MRHRIIVMRRGAICREFARGEATEADILREAIGENAHRGAAGLGSRSWRRRSRAMMESVEFGGLAELHRLSNVRSSWSSRPTSAPGCPVRLRCRPESVFHNFPETLGRIGDQDGTATGHRLWHRAQIFPRTYGPKDNEPVEHAWDGTTLTLPQCGRCEWAREGDSPDAVPIGAACGGHPPDHQSESRGPSSSRSGRCRSWLRAAEPSTPGGLKPHPDVLVPARPLVLGTFTTDAIALYLGPPLHPLRQDPARPPSRRSACSTARAGRRTARGRCLHQTLCVRARRLLPRMAHTETFTDPDMLEVRDTRAPDQVGNLGRTSTTLSPGLLARSMRFRRRGHRCASPALVGHGR